MVTMNIAEVKKMVDDAEIKLVAKAPQLKAFTQMTGFPAIYLVGGIAFLSFLLLCLLSGFRSIVHLVAYIYPAWQSLKVLNAEKRDEDTLWMSYWVIYGFFTALESVTDILKHRIPLYELVKMGFYIYLYEMKGALVVYERVLRPLIINVEAFRSHHQQKMHKDVSEPRVSANAQIHAERSNVAGAQDNINIKAHGNLGVGGVGNVGATGTLGATSVSRNTNTRKID